MTTTEARRIIQALAEGREPTEGSLSPDRPFHQADVLQALAIAARALERLECSEQRQANLPGHTGGAWSPAEEEQLCAEVEAGKSVAEIAQIHQRTRGAIQSRLMRLGRYPRSRE